jgi:Na+-transporting methylmalonyl-CoA/oxaloacetate decarboxylase gamma subunit
MNETLEFLEQLNWFLEPIADLVLYLFTTSTGFILLLLILILTIIFSVYNALKERKLAYMAAKSYSSRIPLLEKLYITGNVVSKIAIKVISNVPVFLMVFLFLFMLVGFSRGISGLNEYVANQEKIKELKSIVKQLDKRYKVAEIEVINYSHITDESQLEIRFFDYAKQGFVNDNQEITIKGDDIYFDAVVLNFDYSEIAEGNKINLALPYRIFSEEVPQEEGIRLSLTDENGVPLLYKRTEDEVYGMSHEKYDERVKEIMQYITDKDKAREAGIRSIYGNAVHKKVKKGETIAVWVEQSGGLVIKNVKDF